MSKFKVKSLDSGQGYVVGDRGGSKYCIVAPNMEAAVQAYKEMGLGGETRLDPMNVEYIGSVIITEGCGVSLEKAEEK